MAANEGTNGHTEVPSDLEKKIIKQIEVSCRLFLLLLICFSAKNPSEWLFTWEAFRGWKEFYHKWKGRYFCTRKHNYP